LAETYIREVVLENFMSHEYSRVPLSPGLNLIVGPNGSGKSSIVLAIAVALGQTRTERGRRLRDLIRRGERIARVTVVLDNTPRDGERPIPFSRADEVRISRYIREDGTYWFELNYKTVDKAELVYRLSQLGIDPDNPLIIMHQGATAELAFMSPQERLRLLEGAAGIAGYREAISDALERLREVRGEEEAVRRELKRIEETLRFWEREYERLLEKRRLRERLGSLRVELAWARVRLREASIERLEERLSRLREELARLRGAVEEADSLVEKVAGEVSSGRVDLVPDLVSAARESGYLRARVEFASAEADDLSARIRREEREAEELRKEAESLGPDPGEVRHPDEVKDEIRAVEARLASLADVDEGVERAYSAYRSAVEELRRRARELEENRRAVSEELERRMKVWRRVVSELVAQVDETYGEILSELGAVGSVRAVGLDDPETAGLEILVGWGGEPIPLNPFTQSGGERITAIVCFLMALQRHIKSPVRVIDEFDVHLDPANREAVLRKFVEVMSSAPGQTILVTPGRPAVSPGVRVIVVQRAGGRSAVWVG